MRKSSFPIWLMLSLGLVIAAVATGGVWFYRTQERDLKNKAETGLNYIASLKVDQIVTWRQERLGDAFMLTDSTFLSEQVVGFLSSSQSGNANEILTYFKSLKEHYNYSDITLVDTNGLILLDSESNRSHIHNRVTASIYEAIRNHQPVISDLHRDTNEQNPHIGIVAPIFTRNGKNSRAIGAIILSIDAKQFLYPLLQSWPAPSRSSEVLLVKRDGNSVLFLNELRFQKNTALKMRIPLSHTEVPAVMAVLGRVGVVEGTDYRGVQVYSAIKAVPDSSWYMIAKVDAREAMLVWRSHSVLILAVSLLFVLIAVVAAILIWRQNDRTHYKRLEQLQAELFEREQNLSTTLNSIGDAVIATDAQGRVTRMNPTAEELTGWILSEALGRPISDILNIVNAQTRKPAPIPVEQVLTTGKVCHLEDHTTLISQCGTEWQIADSAAPIRDNIGGIVGVVLVFSDMSEQYQIREALRDSEDKFRKLVDNALFGVAVHDIVFDESGTPINYVFLQVNPAFESQTGLQIADIQGKQITDAIPEMEDAPFLDVYSRVALTGESVVFEYYVESLNRYFNISAYQVGYGRFATVFNDITERKQSEDALQLEKDNLTAIFASSPIGMLLLDEDTRIVNTNAVVANMVSRNLQDILYKRGGGGLGCIHSYENEKGCGYADICPECSLRHGIEQVLATGIAIHGAEIQAVLLVDGHEQQPWLRISAEPVLLNGRKHVIVAMDDITDRKQAEQALRESEERLSTILKTIDVGITIIDAKTHEIISANPSACRMIGAASDQIENMVCHSFICPAEKGSCPITDKGQFVDRSERTLLTVTKEKIPILKTVVNITLNGRDCLLESFVDITERMLAEKALRDSESTIRNITESAQDAILMMDSQGLIVFWNPAAERIFGYSAEEALGQNLHKFIVPARYQEAHNKAFPGFQRTGDGNAIGQTLELHAIRKDNVEITVSLSLSAVQKNGEWGAVGILRDITAQKQAEEELRRVNAEIDSVNRQLEDALQAAHLHTLEVEVAKVQIEMSAAEMEHQARHDMLTGLPNRLLFSEELDRVISSHSADARQCAVLFLDLDKFKMVNDTMGHKAGDALLVQTAARLSSCLRENDILARMGGDEFTVLLKDIKSIDDPAVVAQRLLRQVSKPYEISGNKLVIGVSIGGSIFPDNATDAVGLLKTADAAMYKAKELGRNNCQFFSDEISQESNAKVEIENDLRLALDRGELKVYYQPIIDVKSMKIAGAEALLRWDHPEKGMISPGLFIPVAEETGLIIEIGRMVIQAAFTQCKSWQDMGYPNFEMSVNVSPAQLGEIDIISEIDGALVDAGLNPSCVKLEVTETVLAKNDNDEVDILSILRSLGMVVCLDDFGIGYSSLSRLNSLPIGHMKIDGYFIKNIAHNRKDRAMTESIIVMAHNLGIKVTAEWIEDEEQMEAIRSLDCDYAQGYLVSPAMSPEKFGDFLRNWDNQHNIIDAA